MLCCIVLYCVVLYCIVLCCIVIYVPWYLFLFSIGPDGADFPTSTFMLQVRYTRFYVFSIFIRPAKLFINIASSLTPLVSSFFPCLLRTGSMRSRPITWCSASGQPPVPTTKWQPRRQYSRKVYRIS